MPSIKCVVLLLRGLVITTVLFYFKSKWCLLIKPSFYFFLKFTNTTIGAMIKKNTRIPKLIHNGIKTTDQDHVINPVSLSTKNTICKTPKIPMPLELLLFLLLLISPFLLITYFQKKTKNVAAICAK